MDNKTISNKLNQMAQTVEQFGSSNLDSNEMKEISEKFDLLVSENEKLTKALEIYERERNRFKHNKPEITGAYFLTGGHGVCDDNLLPEFVRICPAYGCAWEQIYRKTNETISYEGS